MLLPPPAFPVVAFVLGFFCAFTLLIVLFAYFRALREIQTVEDAIYRQFDREITALNDEIVKSEERIMKAIEIQSTYLRDQIETPLTALEAKVDEVENDHLHSTANLKIRVDDLEALTAKSRGGSAILSGITAGGIAAVSGGTITPTSALASAAKASRSRKK